MNLFMQKKTHSERKIMIWVKKIFANILRYILFQEFAFEFINPVFNRIFYALAQWCSSLNFSIYPTVTQIYIVDFCIITLKIRV